jgi:carotenoid cleavage dioxygenase-like enzyme
MPKDRPPSLIHSFSMTKRYIIVIACPVFVPWNGIKILWTRSLQQAVDIRPLEPVHFYVIDRAVSIIFYPKLTTQTREHVATFKSKRGFTAFHTANAFDDETG